MHSARLRLPCRTKEGGKAIAIAKTVSNWAAEIEYRAPPELYLGCTNVCLLEYVESSPEGTRVVSFGLRGSTPCYAVVISGQDTTSLNILENLSLKTFIEIYTQLRKRYPSLHIRIAESSSQWDKYLLPN